MNKRMRPWRSTLGFGSRRRCGDGRHAKRRFRGVLDPPAEGLRFVASRVFDVGRSTSGQTGGTDPRRGFYIDFAR